MLALGSKTGDHDALVTGCAETNAMVLQLFPTSLRMTRDTTLFTRTLLLVTALMIGGTARGGEQQPQQLDAQVPVRLGYWLYLPQDYEQKESWPLMLFLHGSGERGSDLNLVKVHGPPKLIAGGREFPFIVVSPQCPANQRWEPIELMVLLDEIESKYRVDRDRVYVTGLSMGGFGTWELAVHAPDRFAAIAPICGGGETFGLKQISHLPVWAFHGAKDNVVPVERSKVMIEELKRVGGNPKLTIYPDADHDSWTQAYNNPELYKWLLSRKRPSKSESESE